MEQIAGSYVVEIGFRQAWPFLGLCDNRPADGAEEARLYIDAPWSIGAASGVADDDITWLLAAVALNGQTIETARVGDDGSLHLTADSGVTLTVSGEPDANTVGEPWSITGV